MTVLIAVLLNTVAIRISKATFPVNAKHTLFYEEKNMSRSADHFTKAINAKGIRWTVLPDLGREGSAITTHPVTATSQQPVGNSPRLEYEFYTYSKGEVKLNAYFSPTLNFHNSPHGLQFAISIDDQQPQIISINKDEKATEGGINYKWVGDNIIIKNSSNT